MPCRRRRGGPLFLRAPVRRLRRFRPFEWRFPRLRGKLRLAISVAKHVGRRLPRRGIIANVASRKDFVVSIRISARRRPRRQGGEGNAPRPVRRKRRASIPNRASCEDDRRLGRGIPRVQTDATSRSSRSWYRDVIRYPIAYGPGMEAARARGRIPSILRNRNRDASGRGLDRGRLIQWPTGRKAYGQLESLKGGLRNPKGDLHDAHRRRTRCDRSHCARLAGVPSPIAPISHQITTPASCGCRPVGDLLGDGIQPPPVLDAPCRVMALRGQAVKHWLISHGRFSDADVLSEIARQGATSRDTPRRPRAPTHLQPLFGRLGLVDVPEDGKTPDGTEGVGR